MTVKILTDSTSYIPASICEELDITVVSLNVIINHDSKREVDIDLADFYQQLPTYPTIPTSSQPSPEEMLAAFEKLTNDGHEVLGIFLSSKMSGTYSSAHLVKDLILEQNQDAVIEIFDSQTNCMQMGLMAIEAAKAAKQGASLNELLTLVQTIRDNSRFLFTPETLDYLKKGGRIGNASALLGNILQIKPILTVEQGETTVFTKVRTKKKAILKLIEKLKEDLEGRELGGVVVHHINCAAEGQKLAQQIEDELQTTVIIQSIGPVIGCHVGPGSIGIAYFVK
ncbi:DegV family protein [Turicibacter sp. TJ11]|uniref:DegV family protein n=1 Tax=Turicibacter sp. TJ11 TaxID=2806443 RepID=UPI001F1E99D2|nr:DegV family protein [Turicibacter sp. TJ11]